MSDHQPPQPAGGSTGKTAIEKWVGRSLVLLNGLDKESDRGFIVLSISYLDTLLTAALRRVLSKEAHPLLEPPAGDFASFVSRARLACGLGLITNEQLTDLRCLAKMRNAFAHLDDPDMNLEAFRWVELTKGLNCIKKHPPISNASNRDRLSNAIVSLAGHLNLLVRDEKLREKIFEGAGEIPDV